MISVLPPSPLRRQPTPRAYQIDRHEPLSHRRQAPRSPTSAKRQPTDCPAQDSRSNLTPGLDRKHPLTASKSPYSEVAQW